MQTATKKYTQEEFLALEEISNEKHEFFQGEIFAMMGGTFQHARISGNIFAALHIKLRGKSCQPTNSDMCISTPSGLLTYPDISVFCGKPELSDNQRVLLNPVLLVEVLSPSTRHYDQIDKFALYRSIITFSDYLLVDSEKIYVEHFRKIENNEWILHEYTNLAEHIYFNTIREFLALQEIYENIDL